MLTSTGSSSDAPAITLQTQPRAASPIVSTSSATTADFINAYADYADVFEMHRMAHEWIAISLIASILNQRGITFTNGGVKTPFDLWLALLSGSGAGRNTSTYVAQSLVDDAFREIDFPNPISKVSWGSRVAMQQNLSENPTGLFVWEELSAILAKLNSPGWRGAKEWMTDCYDNFKIPDPFRYRTTGKPKSDTPPIEFGQAPRISILASSSWEWFINSMEPSDTMGGFLPRWLLIRIPPSGKVLPRTKTKDETLVPDLVQRLRRMVGLSGSADWSQAEQIYDEWYGPAKKRFESQPNRGLAEPFFNRLRVQTMKLAVIFEVSQSGTLTVSPSAMQRALKIAGEVERTLFEMLPTGMSHEGAELERMLEKVREGKASGIAKSKLTLAFRHWKLLDRNNRINTLVQSESIRQFQRDTLGRAASVYVHADFLKEHAQMFPGDKPMPVTT